jgi:peptidoglycan/xylan/chitin deacetylase (PgdA/CDA1 family)
MGLSRSRKAVLIGTVLVVVGLAGRAAADENPSGHRSAQASATHSASPAKKSAAVKPPHVATKKKATKPKQATVKLAKAAAGPAGSHLSTGTRAVALTFDDGPDPIQTPKILKLLKQHHVHATFCLVGQNVKRHPELVRAIVAGGNTLCDHTWNHSLTIGKKPAAAIRADLQRTKSAILKAAPGAKVEYFRAPGGNFTPRLVSVAKSMGMTSLYWKVDPRDWDHPKGETHAAHRQRVISTVERHVGKGAIVLSHDFGQPDTIAAYRTLLPWLKKRYQLIAMPI